jgi:nicotinamidase-related amidase
MTSLRDRPNAALLVVDVQNDVVANTYRRDDVIANIRDLIGKAQSEPLVHKKFGDAFEDTILESELAQRSVGRLVVIGAQTDACIRATLHGAFTRGYDTLLVADAHTTEDFSDYGLPPADKVIAHTNMYWTWQTGPGRMATVVDATDVDFHEM